MRAYYFDDIPGDQRLPHDSGKPVSNETLKAIGVLHWHIPTDELQSQIDNIAEERSCKNRDTITITKESLGDQYEEKLKIFFEEYAKLPQAISKLSNNIRHMHEDEEIRYILEGSGFFDVRGK